MPSVRRFRAWSCLQGSCGSSRNSTCKVTITEPAAGFAAVDSQILYLQNLALSRSGEGGDARVPLVSMDGGSLAAIDCSLGGHRGGAASAIALNSAQAYLSGAHFGFFDVWGACLVAPIAACCHLRLQASVLGGVALQPPRLTLPSSLR